MTFPASTVDRMQRSLETLCSARRTWITLTSLALPVLVVLMAVSALNGAAEGLWAPRPYNGGLNLYVGNNPAADGTYTPVDEIHPGDLVGRALRRHRGPRR